MALSAEYVHLLNRVLAVNYYGEVMTVEVLSDLLRKGTHDRYRSMIVRQLLDETRHANITRKLLLERGLDPLVESSRSDFTFAKLFLEFAARGGDHVLVFLGENENLSSRNFSTLIRIATRQGDTLTTSLYSEILNDEVRHSHAIRSALPANDPDILQTRMDAQNRMKRLYNNAYLRFYSRFRLQ